MGILASELFSRQAQEVRRATHDGAPFYLIGMGLLGAALVGAIIGKESLDYPTGCL